MIRIKNWSSFQSYKDRRPPWIRLHKTYIDDYAFQKMSVESRALLPMLWLMASEHEDPRSGLIKENITEIAFRLRQCDKTITLSLREIERAGFIENMDDEQLPLLTHNSTDNSNSYINDTDMLRNCHPETESEAETESDRDVTNLYFEKFMESYPKKSHGEEAKEVFESLVRNGANPDDLINAARNYAEAEKDNAKKYLVNPYRFLKNQMHLDLEYNKEPPKPIDMTIYPEWMQTLAKSLEPAIVVNWFGETSVSGDVIFVKNAFNRDWIKNNFMKNLKTIGVKEIKIKT